MSTVAPELARGQTPSTRSISDGNSPVSAEFVLGWLDHAARQAAADDAATSAKAFAEALRGRLILGASDPQVEKRLKEVEKILLGKGLTQKQIVDASKTLSAIAPAPKAMPALPSSPKSGLPARPAALPVVKGRPQPGAPVVTANALGKPQASSPVAPGVFFPKADKTRNEPAGAQVELPGAPPSGNSLGGNELYRRGLELLSKGDTQAAYSHFLQAWQFEGEMDPALRNQLKDKLSAMQAASINRRAENVAASPLRQVNEEELMMRQRMMSEVAGEIAAAQANREAEPQLVTERLRTLRLRVSQANLDGNARKQMLTLVDRAISAHQIYLNQNRAAIDQNMRNRQITEQIALDQEQQFQVNQEIASLVETYNDLMDKGSFAEAEVVAKNVGVLDRRSTIARLLISNARNARRIGEYESIKQRKEDKFIDNLLTVDEAAIPFDDREPMLFPEIQRWEQLTKSRAELVSEAQRGMSAADAAIWEKLKQPVLVDFNQRPLSEVVRVLSDMTGILIHIDPAGLELAGHNSEMPITLSLPSQISLRSALNLMLNTQDLDFQVLNEVLMITSARNAAQANVTRTYSVKDLVIPIPDFVHDYNSGMAGALRQAYETLGRGLVAQNDRPVVGNNSVQFASASMNPDAPVLGQLNNNLPGGVNLPPGIGLRGLGGGGSGPIMGGGGMMGGGMMGGVPMSMGSPGAIGGGAAQADFNTLINLINQTIDPDSWLAAGGTNSILPYPANLSLVVSAPQTTHEKITELLESLRRLQDLQVTIEVKFITLNDNFFERIGVDFDLQIDDNVRQLPEDDSGPSTVVGLNSQFNAGSPIDFTADFDIGVAQDSFTTAVPAFGGFVQEAGASVGFAILSDLEMFFFMNAAQGDQRTNVLQAPRVTMFDGQFASINDTVSRPFVTSLIPVVGDFAVAQQPVIVVLNEGTVLNVQATVSPDKRFVRLTLNPTFSQIDRVDTFTFEGSTTTDSGTNVLDPDGEVTGDTDNAQTTTTGTTVQQPSFAVTSVSTTVSVPDGGTILLGGIKRMREGRIERGVPILSKIPYVNRLFKNTAIGRETSTLMMTVTPRIIIQEEEEQKYDN